MNKKARFRKKIQAFLYDHLVLKNILEYLRYLFFAVAGALIFAIGFTTFITPHLDGITIITGGVSGISQIIVKILEFFGVNLGTNILQSIFYTVLNVPLLIFAFFCVGKKFTIFTTINVFLTSIFIAWFSRDGGLAATLAQANVDGKYFLDSLLIRVIFGGICTGASSALAFVGNISCGGIDIVTYYLGNKKSSQLGKYGIIINTAILFSYSILTIFSDPENLWSTGIFSFIYSCLYLVVCSLVIDLINLKNKKVRIEIITSVKNMGDILISVFPHGATCYDARGVYSKMDKFVYVMTVSSNEYKKVVSVAKEVDEHAFITVSSVVQIYGNFFSKPTE